MECIWELTMILIPGLHMQNKEYINFLAALLYKYRAKHLWIIFISSFLVALISSFFFVSSSIKTLTLQNLELQADFTVQKYRAGKVEDMPKEWLEGFHAIKGIKKITPRVYGMHFYDPGETYFMIVGIDLKSEHSREAFKKAFPNINIEEFLSKENMIIGKGVKQLFDYYEYKDHYTFRPPDKSKQKVYFHSDFDSDTQIFTNDMIIMEMQLAKKILGLKEAYFTDAAIDIQNKELLEDVRTALILSHFDMRIISKDYMRTHYENLFNYKGGVFLALYIFSLITFLLILYQRYSHITHSDAKEIAILRVCGWKISDVIYLKLAENFIVAFVSYMLGVILAYVYVFIFKAPLLKEIFLGFKNLENTSAFSPGIELSSLFGVFFLFIVPFMLVILIPVWKISISEPVEVLR